MTAKKRSNLEKAESLLPVRFRQQSLLEAALTHPSYRHEMPDRKLMNFDRLEFLGDSILNYVISRAVYRLFPEADEGLLSRLRGILVSRKILAKLARETQLSRCLKLGKSARSLPAASRAKILADSFEAFIAAYYFDGSLSKTDKFLMKCFEPYLNPKRLFRLDPNPKSTLQELCQKHWRKLPVYLTRGKPGEITVEIEITKKLKARATAASKKEAEKKAAASMVTRLRQELAASSMAKKSSERKLSRFV